MAAEEASRKIWKRTPCLTDNRISPGCRVLHAFFRGQAAITSQHPAKRRVLGAAFCHMPSRIRPAVNAKYMIKEVLRAFLLPPSTSPRLMTVTAVINTSGNSPSQDILPVKAGHTEIPSSRLTPRQSTIKTEKHREGK